MFKKSTLHGSQASISKNYDKSEFLNVFNGFNYYFVIGAIKLTLQSYYSFLMKMI